MSGLLLSGMLSGMGQGIQQGLGQWQTLIGQRMLLKDSDEMANARQERGFRHAETLEAGRQQHAETLQKENLEAQRGMNQERIGASIAEKGMDVNARKDEREAAEKLKREEMGQAKGLKEQELDIQRGRNKIYEKIADARGVAADASAGRAGKAGKSDDESNAKAIESLASAAKHFSEAGNQDAAAAVAELGVSHATRHMPEGKQPVNPWMMRPGEKVGQRGVLDTPENLAKRKQESTGALSATKPNLPVMGNARTPTMQDMMQYIQSMKTKGPAQATEDFINTFGHAPTQDDYDLLKGE